MPPIKSINGPAEEAGAEQAWVEEVQARLAMVEEGQMEAHDWRESAQWLRAQLTSPVSLKTAAPR